MTGRAFLTAGWLLYTAWSAPARLRAFFAGLVATLLTAGVLSLAGLASARGAEAGPSAATPAPRTIPAPPLAARQYEREIRTSALRVFGLTAPTAVLAAQLHQESSWNPRARSGVGAQGLAQFMPATGRDMAARHPAECAPYNPVDAAWSIRCQHRYMRDLLDSLRPKTPHMGLTPCSAWAFALSAYNGGAGWVERDRKQAQRQGRNADVWFGEVELTPDPRRAPQFVKENRGYPQRILTVLQPRYVKHWNLRGVSCA